MKRVILDKIVDQPSIQCSTCCKSIDLEATELIPNGPFLTAMMKNSCYSKGALVLLHAKTYGLFFCCGSKKCLSSVDELYTKETSCMFQTHNPEGTNE